MAQGKRKGTGWRAAAAWLMTAAAVALCVWAGLIFYRVPYFGTGLRYTLLGCDLYLAAMFVGLCIKYVRSL